jgi:hypothetical protein
MVSGLLLGMHLKSYYRLIQIRECCVKMIDKMPPRPRKIVTTKYYYDSYSESETDDDDSFVFDDESDYDPSRDAESDTETDIGSDFEVSDSEDGTDYETESEPESDSEELNDPLPYYGKGFRVYFDSHEDKKFFMKALGF